MSPRLPHCTGPCQQGHRPCPCPEACGLQREDGPDAEPASAAGALIWPLISIALVGLGALLARACSAWGG